jgi:hypothetical protein
MAPTPFRRRKTAKTMRNLAIAEAALALAKDRALASSSRSRSRRPKRALLLGGAIAAAAGAVLLKRHKVAGLLPSRSGEPEPAAPPPPQQSNYDAPGPVAKTATPVPAPDPQVPEAIDEAAEEAAAAAEARAIGGEPSAYAGPEGEPATAAERPLAEAGEGESEGEEQAEADLAANAEYRDSAPSDAERRVEDTIAEAGQPAAGETPETTRDAQESFLPPAAPAEPSAEEPARSDEPATEVAGEPGATDEPATEAAGEPGATGEDDGKPEPAPEEKKAGEDDADDWRTWSGRSVQP